MGPNSQSHDRERQQLQSSPPSQALSSSAPEHLFNGFGYVETTGISKLKRKRERWGRVVFVVSFWVKGLCFCASNRPTTYPTRDSLVACDEARG